jgi:class 3 adenylate cyclase
MEPVRRKSLREPDERVEFPGVVEEYVDIGGYTVARAIQAPGWRWSEQMGPLRGGEWCESHHVGVVLTGGLGADLRDGTRLEWGPDDVYDIPPGHDGYTVGDEPCVMIEWAGVRTFVGSRGGLGDRVLVSLLFTDLVDSTTTATRIGDVAWHDVLSRHRHTTREQVESFGGRIVEWTGDGLLATFDAPARAIQCAAAILTAARSQDLQIRAGVHVGEVAVEADGLKGVAIHEAARVMAAAGAGQVVVSEITRGLASAAGLGFEDLGSHELKGFPEPQHLFAFRGEP